MKAAHEGRTMNKDETLSLAEAASFLNKETKGLFAVDNIRRIIMAGAQNQIPIYWRNSLQRFSALIGLDGKSLEERARRLMRVSLRDLSSLEDADEVLVTMFEPSEGDRLVLREAGCDDGFLAIIDEPGSAMVSYGKLLVCTQDLLALAREFGDHLADSGAEAKAVEVAQIGGSQKPDADSVASPASGDEPAKNKRWTDDFKAEARAYRDKYGLKKTAQHFGVSQTTISKHIPTGKEKPKPLGTWNALVKK